jgi:putative flippase GtrA
VLGPISRLMASASSRACRTLYICVRRAAANPRYAHAGSSGLLRLVDPAGRYGCVVFRIERGTRRKANWDQLARFCLIGGSGYVVNIVVFGACVRVLGLDTHVAATIAFLGAVGNNFVWNRRWTFPHRGPDARQEVMRFLLVSVCAFLVSISVLTALVTLARVPPIPAQMLSIVLAMPLSFVGNKLWTFRQDHLSTDSHGC